MRAWFKKFAVLSISLLLFSSGRMGAELLAQTANPSTSLRASRTPDWTFAGWFGGGCYPNVEFDPQIKGRIYLTSDVAGIWRSDNSGESWKSINEGLGNLNVSMVLAAPSDSNRLYAGTKTGLYRSADAGDHWERCDSLGGRITFRRPDSYRALTISKSNPAFIAIGTASGEVLISKDSGDSWRNIRWEKAVPRTQQPISALVFSADDHDLWIATSLGLFEYQLNQGSARLVKGSPKGMTDFLISQSNTKIFYAAGQKFLSISEDAGKSWRLSQASPRGSFFRIAEASGEKSKVLFAAWLEGWSGGILKSVDGGFSWQPVEKSMKRDLSLNPTWFWAGPGGRINSLKINPHNSQQMFRTDFWGVYRSDDGGVTWQEKIKGAPNVIGSDLAIDEHGKIYVATMDNGLLASSDGGFHYEALFPSKGYDSKINGHVWRVLVPQKNKVIATSSPWNEDINQVIISQDSGKSFQIVRKGLPSKKPRVNTMWGKGYPRALAVDPSDPNRIYLGIDGDDGGGLFISTDGGQSWKISEGQPGSKRVYNGLAVSPVDPATIYWGAYGLQGGVYRSKDYGRTWKKTRIKSNKIFDIVVSPSGVVYAAGTLGKYGVIYGSSKDGDQWKMLKLFKNGQSCEALCVDPANEKRIFLSVVNWHEEAPGYIYVSENAGSDWKSIGDDLPISSGASAIKIDGNTRTLFAFLTGRSVYRRSLEV